VKAEEITASGTTYTGTGPKVDLTPQYSTKSIRKRTNIVQLVTIKVISDRLHAVFFSFLRFVIPVVLVQ